MMERHSWCYLYFVGLFACSGAGISGSGGSAPTTGGGGPWLHWNLDARPIRVAGSHDAAFVALIPGLSSVELLQAPAGRFVAATLPRPPSHANASCQGYPTALEVLDLTGDGIEDVLVIDPGCQHWVAVGSPSGLFEPRDLVAMVPALPGFRQIAALDVDADGDHDLIAATSYRLILVEQTVPGTWAPPLVEEFPLPQVTDLITRPFAVLPAVRPEEPHRLAFQRGEFIDVFPLVSAMGHPMLGTPSALRLEAAPGPSPWAAYDLWTETAALQDCGIDVLAAALVSPRDGPKSARRLQALHLGGATYRATTWLPDLDVTTFVTLPASDTASILVAVIGVQDGHDFLTLLRSRDCAAPEVLRTEPIDFAWRTIDAPPDASEPQLPRGRGVKVIGYGNEANGIQMIHYDGFDVRTFGLEPSTGWAINSHIEHIHGERLDTVWTKPR
jgi:hypothetical protein